MEITSFNNNKSHKIVRDSKQDNLFNLFQKNIIYDKDIIFDIYVVPREFEMRIDRISNHIYGTPNYVEELMVLNDIISPYSIKEGQYIYFCDVEFLNKLYVKDDMNTDSEERKKKMIKSKKQNKSDTQNKNLSPTIKPNGLQQIRVDKDNRVQIINTFE